MGDKLPKRITAEEITPKAKRLLKELEIEIQEKLQ
jgi:hypothetical protein